MTFHLSHNAPVYKSTTGDELTILGRLNLYVSAARQNSMFPNNMSYSMVDRPVDLKYNNGLPKCKTNF